MLGSSVTNIKFDSAKQKIVQCAGCQREMVVGKFSKNGQRCANCDNTKRKGTTQQAPIEKLAPETFSARLTRIANSLGFSISDKRIWRKTYAMDAGGIMTVHIMVEPSVAGGDPKIDYFSVNIQRAVGISDQFRKIMPPDAAADCEVIADEFAEVHNTRPQIGFQKCDVCGAMTDEYGVDPKTARVLCIKPNACFKNMISRRGAESDE